MVAGSDRSWHNGTYSDVKKVYQNVVLFKRELKADDKKYIEGKLLSHTFLIGRKRFTGGLIGDILIDRMIVNILNNLTNPKCTARTIAIADDTISKLFKLC